MDVILCATRGGEASIKTQERAIEIARERGAMIVFMFVADVRFLDMFTAPRVPAMEGEMEHLGEFMLLMAKERAEKAGVKADYTVKSGVFRQALIEAAQEFAASLIILGSPAEEGLTTLEYLEKELIPAIAEATGSETILV
jgi:nucleotide-binding universal stress UspA family protein